jgi:glycosyltransferase involved in cell wall biosynthesis
VKPVVSVIVPTRGRPHLVGRAVNSILAQTFTDFEIVLVDNNPPEVRTSRQVQRAPWLADPRVRLVENGAARNAASARNLGLGVARGEWVTYLDDDDMYHPRKLERQLGAANVSRLPLGICGTVYHLPGRRRSRCKQVEEITGDDLLLYFLGMPTIFHRRAPEVGFDEALNAGEDVHYFQHLLRYFDVRRVFNVPEGLVDVYQQPNGHVNLNGQGVWDACEATLRDFGGVYSERARRLFRNRARLRFCILKSGHYPEILELCVALIRQQGIRDSRLILNCFLCKIPWMRRWLVY